LQLTDNAYESSVDQSGNGVFSYLANDAGISLAVRLSAG
jgi:hypothetical protein